MTALTSRKDFVKLYKAISLTSAYVLMLQYNSNCTFNITVGEAKRRGLQLTHLQSYRMQQRIQHSDWKRKLLFRA